MLACPDVMRPDSAGFSDLRGAGCGLGADSCAVALSVAKLAQVSKGVPGKPLAFAGRNAAHPGCSESLEDESLALKRDTNCASGLLSGCHPESACQRRSDLSGCLAGMRHKQSAALNAEG